MTITPAQLRIMSDATIEAQQAWMGAFVFEKMGFNWEVITYATGGTKTVIFAQPYATGVTKIDVRVKVFNADGDDIGGQINEATIDNTSFDVYVDEACTLMFLAFEPKVTV